MECKNCNRNFVYDRSKGHRKFICNSCVTTIRVNKLKDKLHKLLGDKCNLCGYNKCREALHFHHINPNNKKFTLAKNWRNKSKKDLIEEVNKCVLLCANCHSEVHAGLTTL